MPQREVLQTRMRAIAAGRSTSQDEEIPRRARIEGSQTFVSLSSRFESNKEKEEDEGGGGKWLERGDTV